MVTDTVKEENKKLATHDSRQEFTDYIKEQLDRINFFYSNQQYQRTYEQLLFLYQSVKALFTTQERSDLETKFKRAVYLRSRYTPRSREEYVDTVLSLLGDLFDTLHNHRLLLPHYEHVEEVLDDSFIERVLREGGL